AVILIFVTLMTKVYYLIFIFVVLSVIIFELGNVFPGFRKVVTTDINVLVTMVIGGLWHGASVNFLIWGGLNGLAVIIYKYWRTISPYEKSNARVVIFWKIFFTFTFITFTRIFFRTADFEKAKQVIHQIFTAFHGEIAGSVLLAYKTVFLIMAIGYIIHWLPSTLKNGIQNWFVAQNTPVKIAVASVAAFVIYQSVSSEFVPFIYFQF